MPDYGLMIVVALGVGAFVYLQMKKAIDKAENEPTNANTKNEKYIKFCELIDKQIGVLRELANDEKGIITDKNRVLDDLSVLSREIVFLQTMVPKNQSSVEWEQKLVAFLSKIEGVADKHFANADEIKDKIRENLQNEFERL